MRLYDGDAVWWVDGAWTNDRPAGYVATAWPGCDAWWFTWSVKPLTPEGRRGVEIALQAALVRFGVALR